MSAGVLAFAGGSDGAAKWARRARDLGLLSIAMLAVMLAPHAFVALYAVLVVVALRGATAAGVALSVSVVFALLNGGLFHPPSVVGLLRWAVLGAATLRIAWDFARGHIPLPISVLGVVGFAFVAIALALAVSWSPIVSLSKLIAFCVGACTLLAACWAPTPRPGFWREWMATLWIFVCVWSAPLQLVAVGRFTNQTGFQGIMAQPQAMGIFIAPIVAWTTGRVVADRFRAPVMLVAAFGAWFFLFTSASRTALVAVMSGGILALVALLIGQSGARAAVRRGARRPSAWVYALVVLALAGASGVALRGVLYDFLLKGQDAALDADTLTLSRGLLILSSMDNFLQHPVAGIGFGMPTNRDLLEVDSDPLTGLPLSAPVEKGFIGTALLEELGLVGTVAFAVMFLLVAWPVMRRGRFTDLWTFFAAFATNAGEVTFFSFAGLGLYVWLVMAVMARNENDDAAAAASSA